MIPTKRVIREICERHNHPFWTGLVKKVRQRYNRLSHTQKGQVSVLDLMKK